MKVRATVNVGGLRAGQVYEDIDASEGWADLALKSGYLVNLDPPKRTYRAPVKREPLPPVVVHIGSGDGPEDD